jgi:hypothetical protein
MQGLGYSACVRLNQGEQSIISLSLQSPEEAQLQEREQLSGQGQDQAQFQHRRLPLS